MGWLVWIALAIGAIAVFAAFARALRDALSAWRSFKRLRRATGRSLAELEATVTRFADNAAKERPTPELDRALSRLRASTARLNVLRRAVGDVADAAGNVTGVYPRK